jgi:hypothetical protein
MEIDSSIVYPNVQYSTWNDQKFWYICTDSFNFSSSDLTSFNIFNDSSFVQHNDMCDTNDTNDAYDTNDVSNASGMNNKALINDDIFKVSNNSIDNNCDNKNFFICINFRRMEMFKEVLIMIVV